MAVQAALFELEAIGSDLGDLPPLPDADVRFRPHLYSPADAACIFEELLHSCDWQQRSMHMYGREVAVPRLSAWYGEPDVTYAYSGIPHEPARWTPALREVKAAVEAELGQRFNSVLANLYRDGRDSVAWHADDERELGHHPVIASVSFGATRRFDLRQNADHTLRRSYELTPGSLLVMAGPTQHHWQHRVAKTAKPTGPRINLTFRRTGANRPGQK